MSKIVIFLKKGITPGGIPRWITDILAAAEKGLESEGFAQPAHLADVRNIGRDSNGGYLVSYSKVKQVLQDGTEPGANAMEWLNQHKSLFKEGAFLIVHQTEVDLAKWL